MRVVLATAIVASLALPAFAQQSHVPQYGETEKEKTTSQKAADKAAADAYKRSLGAIPDKGPGHPWGARAQHRCPGGDQDREIQDQGRQRRSQAAVSSPRSPSTRYD